MQFRTPWPSDLSLDLGRISWLSSTVYVTPPALETAHVTRNTWPRKKTWPRALSQKRDSEAMWIDLKEAATKLNISTAALRQSIARGGIPDDSFRKFGSCWAIEDSWVEWRLWSRPARYDEAFVLEEEDVAH